MNDTVESRVCSASSCVCVLIILSISYYPWAITILFLSSSLFAMNHWCSLTLFIVSIASHGWCRCVYICKSVLNACATRLLRSLAVYVYVYHTVYYGLRTMNSEHSVKWLQNLVFRAIQCSQIRQQTSWAWCQYDFEHWSSYLCIRNHYFYFIFLKKIENKKRF